MATVHGSHDVACGSSFVQDNSKGSRLANGLDNVLCHDNGVLVLGRHSTSLRRHANDLQRGEATSGISHPQGATNKESGSSSRRAPSSDAVTKSASMLKFTNFLLYGASIFFLFFDFARM